MKKTRVFGTGGELLVRQLVAQGVAHAFTNTGSAEAGFFNALLTVRTNFHAFGGEMAKQEKYPEVYLGDIDFVMLAKSQGVDGTQVREPEALEAALRRGADAITAGEPYVLDVRVATMGAGADSTWHQRYKLRG